MIERLPTPWGLVRSGVAPDHPKIKSVTRIYEKTAAHPRFRFFGNVHFGEHVSREELLDPLPRDRLRHRLAVDRPLGIPGEDLPGSHAATEFVGWYNGHPDHTDLEVDLRLRRARRRDRQRQRRSRRRPHARADAVPSSRPPTPPTTRSRCSRTAACSEVWSCSAAAGPHRPPSRTPSCGSSATSLDADVIVDAAELERALAVADPTPTTTAQRNVEILRDYASRQPLGRRRRIVLRFLLSPVALLGRPSTGDRRSSSFATSS